MKVLLDTHILLWWLADKTRLSNQQQQIIDQVQPANPLLLADISLWEIATLYSLGRITLTLPLRDWLERAVSPPLVQVCPITPAIAAQVAALPDTFHRDPGDRIIVATAQMLGATLLTRDDRIIKAALVSTVN